MDELLQGRIDERIAARKTLAEQCRLQVSKIVVVSRLARRCRILLAIVAALIVLPVQAGQLSLLLNGKALHLEESQGVDFNEENWGAGLHYDFTAEETQMGSIPDSLRIQGLER